MARRSISGTSVSRGRLPVSSSETCGGAIHPVGRVKNLSDTSDRKLPGPQVLSTPRPHGKRPDPTWPLPHRAPPGDTLSPHSRKRSLGQTAFDLRQPSGSIPGIAQHGEVPTPIVEAQRKASPEG